MVKNRPVKNFAGRILFSSVANGAKSYEFMNEKRFLEGPKNYWQELKFIIRAFIEFFGAIRRFHSVGPCITFFGSAKIKPESEYYELAKNAASELAKSGFAIMTGGGPGAMEAANQGAKMNKARSIACNIVLPHEQFENPYLDTHYTTKFFFVRKVVLVKYSYGFVVLPGGIGTIDELFEVLTLIRTGKSPEVPVVLLGSKYWAPLLTFIEELIDRGMAEPSDRELIFVTDSVDEVLKHIQKGAIHKLSKRRNLKAAFSKT